MDQQNLDQFSKDVAEITNDLQQVMAKVRQKGMSFLIIYGRPIPNVCKEPAFAGSISGNTSTLPYMLGACEAVIKKESQIQAKQN